MATPGARSLHLSIIYVNTNVMACRIELGRQEEEIQSRQTLCKKMPKSKGLWEVF